MQRLAILTLLCMLSLVPTWADPHYDILVVGDESTDDGRKFVHNLVMYLEQTRSQMGLTHQDLPIDIYDVSGKGKAGAQRLGLTGNGFYVAFCQLGGEQALPMKILEKEGPFFVAEFRAANQACIDLMGAAGKQLGVRLAWFGIQAQSVKSMRPEDRERRGLADVEGVIVSDVVEGSPADAAGILRGDVITSIDRRPMQRGQDMAEVIHSHKPKDQIDVVIYRHGETMTVTVTLEAAR